MNSKFTVGQSGDKGVEQRDKAFVLIKPFLAVSSVMNAYFFTFRYVR